MNKKKHIGLVLALVGAAALEGLYGCAAEEVEDAIDESVGSTTDGLTYEGTGYEGRKKPGG